MGSVALMYIEINDEDFCHGAFMTQLASRDGDIIEDTEPRTMSGEGVVGATGGVAAKAVAKGEAGREKGSTDGDVCPADEIRGPGQADPTKGPGLYPVRAEGLHIIGVMGPQENVFGEGAGSAEIVLARNSLSQEAGMEGLELGHWEAMSRRQLAVVIRVVHKGNTHHFIQACELVIANRERDSFVDRLFNRISPETTDQAAGV